MYSSAPTHGAQDASTDYPKGDEREIIQDRPRSASQLDFARRCRGDEGPGTCGCWGSSVGTGAQVASLMVMLAAVAISYVGLYTAPTLLGHQSSVGYQAPEGSPSLLASNRLHTMFPLLQAAEAQVVVLIRAANGHDSVLTDDVMNFSRTLVHVARTDNRTKILSPAVTGYYAGADRIGLEPEDDLLRDGFVSKDGKVTVVVFMATKGLRTYNWWVRDRIMAALEEVTASPPKGTQIFITGNPAIEHDQETDHSIETLLRVEICTIPVAIGVLACLVKNWRLLIIPPVVLLVTFFTATSLVLPTTWYLPDFSADIPPAMLSVCIALSLDYSLFMLTRFNENRMTMTLNDNIAILVRHTAHTLGVSGLLIAVAFFGAVAIPEKNLQGAGIALGFTTVACLIVSSTLTPALLCIFGRALTAPLCGVGGMFGFAYVAPEEETQRMIPMPPNGGHREQDEGFWLRLMEHVEKRPRVAVAAVFLAFFPLLVQLPWLNITADTYAMIPETLDSMQGLRALQESGLPVGRFDPYTVVVSTNQEPPEEGDKGLMLPNGNMSAMLTEHGFNAMLDLCKEFHGQDGVSALIGPAWMMDHRVDWNHAKYLRLPQKIRSLYLPMLSTHVKSQAAVFQVHTDFVPRGAGASKWVLQMRRRLADFERRHPEYNVTLSGGSTMETDIRAVVLDAMPIYIGTTVCSVMVLVFMLFRSVMLPMRLGFALLFTLGATFSVAHVVYQTPLLHPFIPVLKYYDGVCYQAVPIGICIAVALGLDYDIFLISRVVELRKSGFSDRDSIVQGVAKTGGIISGAGLIMALAFSGLLFSPKMMHQQFALLLVCSVLLDTFVVRTVLVPALMLSAEGWNWWPYEMPAVKSDDSLGATVECGGKESLDS